MAQDFNRVFGSTGTSDTFSDADYNEGLEAIVGSVPPSKGQHNGIWNEVDQKLLELKGQGVGVWDAAIQYTANKSISNVDGVLYRCLISNVGVEPSNDTSGKWELLIGASLIGADGYQVLDSGVIIQWGFIVISDIESPYNYPVPFTSQAFSIVATPGNSLQSVYFEPLSQTQFRAKAEGGTPGCRFIAIGV